MSELSELTSEVGVDFSEGFGGAAQALSQCAERFVGGLDGRFHSRSHAAGRGIVVDMGVGDRRRDTWQEEGPSLFELCVCRIDFDASRSQIAVVVVGE